MFKKCTVFSLILIVAMNSLLASAGGTVLCLHDHNFGHVLSVPHSELVGDCHEGTSERHDKHESESASGFVTGEERHCVDIIVSASDEPINRFAHISLIKKDVIANVSYQQFVPILRACAATQIGPRAPPCVCSTLEQCVRTTVLRL